MTVSSQISKPIVSNIVREITSLAGGETSLRPIRGWTGLKDCYVPVFAKFNGIPTPLNGNFLISGSFASTVQADEGTISLWFNPINESSGNADIFDIGDPDSSDTSSESTRVRLRYAADSIAVSLGNFDGSVWTKIAEASIPIGSWQYGVPNFLYLTYKNNSVAPDFTSRIQVGINGAIVTDTAFTIPDGQITFKQDDVVVIGARHTINNAFGNVYSGELSEVWSTRQFLEHNENIGSFINTQTTTVNFPNGIPVGRNQGEGVVGASPSNHFGGLGYTIDDWNAGKNNVDQNNYVLNNEDLKLGSQLETKDLVTVEFNKSVSYVDPISGVMIFSGEKEITETVFLFNGDGHIEIPSIAWLDNLISGGSIEFEVKHDDIANADIIADGSSFFNIKHRVAPNSDYRIKAYIVSVTAGDSPLLNHNEESHLLMSWTGSGSRLFVNEARENSGVQGGLALAAPFYIGSLDGLSSFITGYIKNIIVKNLLGEIVHQWKINEGVGTTVFDTGSGGVEGIVNGTLFPGTGDWTTVTTLAQVDKTFTIESSSGNGTKELIYKGSRANGWEPPLVSKEDVFYNYDALVGDYADSDSLQMEGSALQIINCESPTSESYIFWLPSNDGAGTVLFDGAHTQENANIDPLNITPWINAGRFTSTESGTEKRGALAEFFTWNMASNQSLFLMFSYEGIINPAIETTIFGGFESDSGIRLILQSTGELKISLSDSLSNSIDMITTTQMSDNSHIAFIIDGLTKEAYLYLDGQLDPLIQSVDLSSVSSQTNSSNGFGILQSSDTTENASVDMQVSDIHLFKFEGQIPSNLGSIVNRQIALPNNPVLEGEFI